MPPGASRLKSDLPVWRRSGSTTPWLAPNRPPAENNAQPLRPPVYAMLDCPSHPIVSPILKNPILFCLLFFSQRLLTQCLLVNMPADVLLLNTYLLTYLLASCVLTISLIKHLGMQEPGILDCLFWRYMQLRDYLMFTCVATGMVTEYVPTLVMFCAAELFLTSQNQTYLSWLFSSRSGRAMTQHTYFLICFFPHLLYLRSTYISIYLSGHLSLCLSIYQSWYIYV